MRLYFNGAVVAQKFTSVRPLGDISPSYQPGIGIGNTPGGGGFPFIGLVDELLLYSRALSPTEVQALAQAAAIPPIVDSQPANQTVWLGDTALFTVSASGTAPLIYQWRFNGINISGATTSSLLLTNLQLAQSGSYSAQITNSIGSTNSSSAVLTVNPQPYPYSVPPAGLIGWWRAEGNGNDSSGHGHNGTLLKIGRA